MSHSRFMNATLTFSKGVINLGLQPLHGTLNAAALTEFLSAKLEEFEINPKWIFGLTSDGASVEGFPVCL